MLNLKPFILIMVGTVLIYSINTIASSKEPSGIEIRDLNYQIDLEALKRGEFQYFYSLIKQSEDNKNFEFVNISNKQPKVKADIVIKTFLPLDIKNLWDSRENNYLAVAKFNYILPINIKVVDKVKFSSTEYLQSTLPRYKVSQEEDYFHVSGSLITPSFDFTLTFLDPNHPYTKLVKQVDKSKMLNGKMKVSFMFQENFGRVMFFKTAKTSSAMIIYEGLDSTSTLVTQYILSNVINVP
jgi:hypothetical protein